MKFCVKCGKELSENGMCTCCNDAKAIKPSKDASEKKANKFLRILKSKIILCTAAILLLLGVVAGVLFVPRDIELDDIKKCNEVTAIIQYGAPSIRESDTFYGVKPLKWKLNFDDNSVVFFFREGDEQYIYQMIKSNCKFERGIGGSFHEFSYGNLWITTYDYSGSYVSIEIK